MNKTLEQQLLCLAHYVRDPAGSAAPPGKAATNNSKRAPWIQVFKHISQ